MFLSGTPVLFLSFLNTNASKPQTYSSAYTFAEQVLRATSIPY